MYLLTMGSMKTLVLSLFALFAFTSAVPLKITNNCPVDFEYATFSFNDPSGCSVLDKIPGGNDDAHEFEFSIEDQRLIIKRSTTGMRQETGVKFIYETTLDTFLNEIEVQDTYGVCNALYESEPQGVFEVYSVENYDIELCGSSSPIEPPLPTKTIKIENTCAHEVAIGGFNQGNAEVSCTELKTLLTGEGVDISVVYPTDMMIIRGEDSVTSKYLTYQTSLGNALGGYSNTPGCDELMPAGGDLYTIADTDSIALCGKPSTPTPTEDPKPTPTPTEDPKPTPTPTEDPKPTPTPEKPSSPPSKTPSPPSKTPSPPSKTSDDSSSGISIGIIIGAAVGGVALIVGVIVACVCIKKRKKNRQDPVLDTVSHDTFVVPIVSSYASHPAPARPVVDQVISGNDHQIVNIV